MNKYLVDFNTVVCAFPGTGKSILRGQYPNKIVKLTADDYVWPMVKNRVKVYPANFIAAAINRKEVVLTDSRHDIRDCLAINKIPYIVCYPRLDDKRVYLDRYRDMGKNSAYIRMMDIMWCDLIAQIKQDGRAVKRIEIEKGNYLCDEVGIF
jgi:hypothetical protein